MVDGSKVTFMWKPINIKFKDAIKGDSHFEFYPSATVKSMKDMLKDNQKIAYDDYEFKLENRVLEDDKTLLESNLKQDSEVTLHYFQFGIKIKLPGQE
jgi:hypothetical protein